MSKPKKIFRKLLPIGVFAVLAVWVLLYAPATTISLELVSEIVSVTITNPPASRMRFAHAKLAGNCVTDLSVSPGLKSNVTYSRAGRGPLMIVVTGGLVLEQGAGGEREALQDTVLEIGPNTCGGKAVGHARLPLVGPAVFGRRSMQPNDGESDVLSLISGQISIFARATSDFFGIPLGIFPFERNALYQTHLSILPGGSVVSSFGETRGATTAHAPAWYGFVNAGFDDNDPAAMTVSATANSAKVYVYFPAPRVVVHGMDPASGDIVPVALSAKLTGDPNLQVIFGAFAVLAAILSMRRELVELGQNDGEEIETSQALSDGVQAPSRLVQTAGRDLLHIGTRARGRPASGRHRRSWLRRTPGGR